MSYLIALFSGFLFAVGLSVSGMTRPSKVQGFLDITGYWDYSLAFVMVGAIVVHTVAYLIKNKMSKPKLASSFQVPTNKKIDKSLIIGGVLFGAGWALAGYCPGPALTSLGSGATAPVIFVIAMSVGLKSYDWLKLGK